VDSFRRFRRQKMICKDLSPLNRTLETTQIPISPMCIGEGVPAFSHNGEYLAYWCLRRGVRRPFYIPYHSGRSAENNSKFRGFFQRLTWSADDEKLIYSLLSSGEVRPQVNSVKLL